MSRPEHEKRLLRTGAGFVCVLAMAAVVLLVLQVFANSGRALPGGFRFLVVLSGSMEPELPVGSVIVTRSVDPADVRAGEIITFTPVSDPSRGSVPFATHRVTRVLQGADGPVFATKGDANPIEDADPVAAGQVAGRVALTVPVVGRIAMFAQSALGMALLVFLPATVLVAWEGIGLLRRRRNAPQTVAVVAIVMLVCFIGASQAGKAAGRHMPHDKPAAAAASQMSCSAVSEYSQLPDPGRFEHPSQ